MAMAKLIRRTKPREIICEALRRAARPLSPAELFEHGKALHPSLSLATVYRTIKTLCEDGELSAVTLPGCPARYESKECAAHHHHHFHCQECDRVFDVDGCHAEHVAEAPDGFLVQSHQVVLYGLCKECRGS